MNGRQDMGNLISDVFNTWDFNPSGSEYPRLGIVEDDNGNYVKFSDIFLEKGRLPATEEHYAGLYAPETHHPPHRPRKRGSLRVYMSIDNVATITVIRASTPKSELRCRRRCLSRIAFL